MTEFLICFFDHQEWQSNPGQAGNVCANKVWILDPWPQISFCATYNTDDNIYTFLKMRDKTALMGPTYSMKQSLN